MVITRKDWKSIQVDPIVYALLESISERGDDLNELASRILKNRLIDMLQEQTEREKVKQFNREFTERL